MSGGLSVASSRFFVSGPKTGNTKQRKKDNFVGKDGGQGRWWMGKGGEKVEKGRVGGRKNKPKKAKFVCKKKKPRQEKNVFLQPNFVPLPRKSHAPKKRLVLGVRVPKWAEACLRTY